MPISALPTPPQRSDPTNFASRGDTFMAALPTFVTEANTLETNVNAKEATATAAASTATTQAGNASTSATTATTQAGIATTQAGNALASANAAAASAASITAQVATATTAATSKATPADADEIPLTDSAASFGLKKLTWANVKATLKTYFDSVTTTLTNKTLTSPVISGGSINSTPIGSTTPSTGAFTTLSATTSAKFGGAGTGGLAYKQAASSVWDGIVLEALANQARLIVYEDTSQWNINATYGSSGAYKDINIVAYGAEKLRITSTGAAVTGTLSATTASTNELSVNAAANSEAAVRIATAGGVYGRFFLATPASNSKIGLDCQGTTVMTILNGQSLALQGASTSAGTGITFPAVQSPSSDPNTQDDYEEWTWTPTATNITGTNTYSGKYTKIGNVVHVTVIITTSTAIGTTVNSSTLTLPFASGSESVCSVANRNTAVGYSTGLLQSASIFLPTTAPTAGHGLVIQATYFV